MTFRLHFFRTGMICTFFSHELVWELAEKTGKLAEKAGGLDVRNSSLGLMHGIQHRLQLSQVDVIRIFYVVSLNFPNFVRDFEPIEEWIAKPSNSLSLNFNSNATKSFRTMKNIPHTNSNSHSYWHSQKRLKTEKGDTNRVFLYGFTKMKELQTIEQKLVAKLKKKFSFKCLLFFLFLKVETGWIDNSISNQF